MGCREGFGHMVEWQGQQVDVLSITGASPDALLVRAEEGSERVYAVIEAKSRVPFMKLSGTQNGTFPPYRQIPIHDHHAVLCVS
jgi:hypothetical protein